MFSSSRHLSRLLLRSVVVRPTCSSSSGGRSQQLLTTLSSSSTDRSFMKRTQNRQTATAAAAQHQNISPSTGADPRPHPSPPPPEQDSSVPKKSTSEATMLRVKKQQRKRRALLQTYQGPGPFLVGMARAEAIDLTAVNSDPRITYLYQATFVSEDSEEVLHLVPKQKYMVDPEAIREFYVFSDGVVIFFNLDDAERSQILERLRTHEIGTYPQNVIDEETDKMKFQLVNEGKTGIKGSKILLSMANKGHQSNKAISERFAFAHGMALSVKVGIWESQLDTTAEPLLSTAKALCKGCFKYDQKAVHIKYGELHTLRQTINLDCELTNPDYYWDRPDLEFLYKESLRHFEIQRRLAMINKKIDYCEEMMHMLNDSLSHKHSSKLEWIIIILIVFEVVFESIHLAERQEWISFPMSFGGKKDKTTSVQIDQ